MVLAVGASTVVLVANALGTFSGIMAAGAVAGAVVIAAVSARQAHRRWPVPVLPPLADTRTEPAVIGAPRASELVGRPDNHSDAA